MPFKSTNVIPSAPSVTVFFHGLLSLSPNEDGTCSVGVHRTASDHNLLIRVCVVNRCDPYQATLFRVFGPLQGREFSIEVVPQTNLGVSKYLPTEYFDRATATDACDYRWAIDLISKEFHGEMLQSDSNVTQPGIRLSDGLIYTARKTDEKVVELERTGGGKDPLNLHSIASIIGANIYLDDGSGILLRWQQGGDYDVPLPKLPDGMSYAIYISNDPDLPGPPPHSEFEEYYKALKRAKTGSVIAPIDRFELRVTPLLSASGSLAKYTPFGSDRIPCMPIMLDE